MSKKHKVLSVVTLGHWLVLLVVGSALVARAHSFPSKVYHSFQFNAKWDSPEIEILDYLYGDSKGPGVRPPDWMRKSESINQSEGIYTRSFIATPYM